MESMLLTGSGKNSEAAVFWSTMADMMSAYCGALDPVMPTAPTMTEHDVEVLLGELFDCLNSDEEIRNAFLSEVFGEEESVPPLLEIMLTDKGLSSSSFSLGSSAMTWRLVGRLWLI